MICYSVEYRSTLCYIAVSFSPCQAPKVRKKTRTSTPARKAAGRAKARPSDAEIDKGVSQISGTVKGGHIGILERSTSQETEARVRKKAASQEKQKARVRNSPLRILRTLHAPALPRAENSERASIPNTNCQDAPRASAATGQKQREGRRFQTELSGRYMCQRSHTPKTARGSAGELENSSGATARVVRHARSPERVCRPRCKIPQLRSESVSTRTIPAEGSPASLENSLGVTARVVRHARSPRRVRRPR